MSNGSILSMDHLLLSLGVCINTEQNIFCMWYHEATEFIQRHGRVFPWFCYCRYLSINQSWTIPTYQPYTAEDSFCGQSLILLYKTSIVLSYLNCAYYFCRVWSINYSVCCLIFACRLCLTCSCIWFINTVMSYTWQKGNSWLLHVQFQFLYSRCFLLGILK